MNKKLLNTTFEFFKDYELEKKDEKYIISNMQFQIFIYLIKEDYDISEIKTRYKTIVNEMAIFENDIIKENYLDHIYVMLDFLKKIINANKNIDKNMIKLDVFYDDLVISNLFKNEMGIGILHKRNMLCKTYYKIIDYANIQNKSIKDKDYFIKKGNSLLNRYIPHSVNQEKNWKEETASYLKDFEIYLIAKYGRISEQYEKFILRDYKRGYPITPNACMMAVNHYKLEDIKLCLKIL